MSSLIIIIGLISAIALVNYLIFNSTTSKNNPDIAISIAIRIENELNNYYGKSVVTDISMSSLGNLFLDADPLNISSVYILSVKVRNNKKEKCLSILIEDLTDMGIHMVVNDLIQKINAPDKLRISC